MLYSKHLGRHQKVKLSGIDTQISGNRVFDGTYWDEFGLTLSHKSAPRVLVIGAGHGACIRPILAQNPEARISLVDVDSEALSTLNKIYAKHFPQIDFELINADAGAYPLPPKSYDAIWLDTYSDTGFAPIMFDRMFLHRCVNALTSGGAIYVNLFSAPCYLYHSSTNPWLEKMVTLLLTTGGSVFVFPHRRNYTLVFSQSSHLTENVGQNPTLVGTDRLNARAHRLRRRLATPLPTSPGAFFTNATPGLDFSDVQAEFRKKCEKRNAQLESTEKLRNLEELSREFAIFSAESVTSDPPQADRFVRMIDGTAAFSKKDRSNTVKWLLPHLVGAAATMPNPDPETIQQLDKLLVELER